MTLTWQDRAEIVELGARLAHASDNRDGETWLALFDEDGRLEVNGNTLCRGREEMAAYFERARAQPVKRRHWTCNLIVDAGDVADEARFRSYVAVYDITDGMAAAPYMLGQYDDLVVKSSGQWLFKARRLTTLAGGAKPA